MEINHGIKIRKLMIFASWIFINHPLLFVLTDGHEKLITAQAQIYAGWIADYLFGENWIMYWQLDREIDARGSVLDLRCYFVNGLDLRDVVCHGWNVMGRRSGDVQGW